MFSSNTSQVSEDANYIEQVFATHLYTGNGSTQTITNGIDLAGEGGLVWIKKRNAAQNNVLFDTERGMSYSSPFAKPIFSNLTNAQGEEANLIQSNNDGFSLGSNSSGTFNTASATYASWTFRKQPKFFDVVTWSGDGTSNRSISHNLGSVPGCIVVKCTSNAVSWLVWHRSFSDLTADYLVLDSTVAVDTATGLWGSTPPDSASFRVGPAAGVNGAGRTYVAYLFAHNAGGFGLTGTDNVISCGSFTTDGATTTTVNLGWEPQWVLVKVSNEPGHWFIGDNMRGMPVSGNQANLFANLSNAETQNSYSVRPTATGFEVPTSSGFNNPGQAYIYIAIRRGPMRTPTSGTSVFSPDFQEATPPSFNTGFVADAGLRLYRPGGGEYTSYMFSRLTGTAYMSTTNTNAESTTPAAIWDFNNGWGDFGLTTTNVVNESFRRAPGFFDVVCYTGTGSARTVNHNLGVAPELMIVKKRSTSTGSDEWMVYAAPLSANGYLWLNDTRAYSATSVAWNNTAPTSSVFTVGTYGGVNGSGETYVAYLFASCPGVSKCGSYTGTGTTQQINCGFTSGARFVLIKRTDSTGDWYVWDSARGIVAGNDPYLLLNSTAAEVTNTDYVDTYSAGFEISSTAPAAINANGGTFIFLAIA